MAIFAASFTVLGELTAWRLEATLCSGTTRCKAFRPRGFTRDVHRYGHHKTSTSHTYVKTAGIQAAICPMRVHDVGHVS